MNCLLFLWTQRPRTHFRNSLHLLVAIAVLSGCSDLSSTPDSNQTDSATRFHGTWLWADSQSDSAKISFDVTTMKFIDQFYYQYGMRREFPGSISVNNTSITLQYDDYDTRTWNYQFVQESLILTTPPNGIRTLVRLSSQPAPFGWSRKLAVLSEFTLGPLNGYLMSFCRSDSGMFALVYGYNQLDRRLIKIGLTGVESVSPASGINAIEARGPYLWVATDSTIDKRTITDPKIISTFRYTDVVGPTYRALGVAVDSTSCFVMTVSSVDFKGKLLRFTLNGALIGATETSIVLKDLALVGSRLFCLTGDETFCELNPATGRVVINCNVQNRFFRNNIDGIAFTGTTILLASLNSQSNLRLTNVSVP